MPAQALREIAYRDYRARLEVLLRIPIDASDQDIQGIIEDGFSARHIKTLCELGLLTPQELEQIIPSTSLKSRMARDELLTADESDCLFRVVHITALAEAVFADDEKARRWLIESKERFSGKSPRAMLSTIQGACQVEGMLVQIAEGFAF